MYRSILHSSSQVKIECRRPWIILKSLNSSTAKCFSIPRRISPTIKRWTVYVSIPVLKYTQCVDSCSRAANVSNPNLCWNAVNVACYRRWHSWAAAKLQCLFEHRKRLKRLKTPFIGVSAVKRRPGRNGKIGNNTFNYSVASCRPLSPRTSRCVSCVRPIWSAIVL